MRVSGVSGVMGGLTYFFCADVYFPLNKQNRVSDELAQTDKQQHLVFRDEHILYVPGRRILKLVQMTSFRVEDDFVRIPRLFQRSSLHSPWSQARRARARSKNTNPVKNWNNTREIHHCHL